MSLRTEDWVNREAQGLLLAALGDPEGSALPDEITINLRSKPDFLKAQIVAWVRGGLWPTAAFASIRFWDDVADLERSADTATCSWIVHPAKGGERRCFGKDKWGGHRGSDLHLGVPLCRDHGEALLSNAARALGRHRPDVVEEALEAAQEDTPSGREIKRLIDNEISRRMEERWAA